MLLGFFPGLISGRLRVDSYGYGFRRARKGMWSRTNIAQLISYWPCFILVASVLWAPGMYAVCNGYMSYGQFSGKPKRRGAQKGPW